MDTVQYTMYNVDQAQTLNIWEDHQEETSGKQEHGSLAR